MRFTTMTAIPAAVLAAALAVAAAPAFAAGGSCAKPGVPVCMDDSLTFVSADRMTACQSDVKEYVDRTMAYLKCLADENVATGQELTRNIDRFNCRLSGGKSCG
ncbi:MAG TPA: hypothetical protein VGE72_24670 [Azospirillum sp.]